MVQTAKARRQRWVTDEVFPFLFHFLMREMFTSFVSAPTLSPDKDPM